MTTFIIFLVTGLILFTVQATLLHCIPLIVKKIDLLPVLVMYLGFHHGLLIGGLLSFLFGVTVDIYSGGFPGLHGGLYLLILFMARFCAKHLMLKSIIREVWTIVFCTSTAGFLLILTLNVLLSTYPIISSTYKLLLPQTLITGIISPLLLWLFKNIGGLNQRDLYEPVPSI